MKNPRLYGSGTQPLRLLLVGGSEQEFAEMRRLLAEMEDDRFHLNHAVLAEDVLNQLERGSYDLLFCSRQSTDDAAIQLLRQVREHDSRVPVFFLGEEADEVAVMAAIHAVRS